MCSSLIRLLKISIPIYFSFYQPSHQNKWQDYITANHTHVTNEIFFILQLKMYLKGALVNLTITKLSLATAAIC